MITAYRILFRGIVNRMLIDRDCNLFLPHANGNGVPMIALWDTGATCTCISEAVAQKMSLKSVNQQELTVADNKKYLANVYCVKLQMGGLIIENMEVCGLPMDGKSENMIIGMDVISMGDLAITNYNGQTFLTFRVPSIERIDYVEEINQYNKCLKAHSVKVNKGITDKCECGSGKYYNNCHGQSVYAKYENSLLLDSAKLNKK